MWTKKIMKEKEKDNIQKKLAKKYVGFHEPGTRFPGEKMREDFKCQI